jgi:hypothetical protein
MKKMNSLFQGEAIKDSLLVIVILAAIVAACIFLL